MPIAKFKDLNKDAKDTLEKDYTHGFVNFEGVSKTINKVEFKATAKRDHVKKSLVSNFEIKHSIDQLGLNLTERLHSSNQFQFIVEAGRLKVAPGLKVTFDGTFNINHAALSSSPAKLAEAAIISTDYEHPKFRNTVDYNLAKQVVDATVVGKYQNYLFGLSLKYNFLAAANKSQTTAHPLQTDYTLGYTDADYSVAATSNGTSGVKLSVFHKVTPTLDVASMIDIPFGKTNGIPVCVLGGVYRLDAATSVKAKISQTGTVSVSYSQMLRKGVKLQLGAEIDSLNLSTDAHKMGAGFFVTI